MAKHRLTVSQSALGATQRQSGTHTRTPRRPLGVVADDRYVPNYLLDQLGCAAPAFTCKPTGRYHLKAATLPQTARSSGMRLTRS